MPQTSKQKTTKLRAKRAALGLFRHEFSLTDIEFKKVKEFILNLRR